MLNRKITIWKTVAMTLQHQGLATDPLGVVEVVTTQLSAIVVVGCEALHGQCR